MAIQPALTVLPNPNPKTRFLTHSPAHTISKHREMVDSEAFQKAVDFSLLQYQADLSNQIRDGNTAATAGFKMQGVIEFMGILRNLSETPTPPRRESTDNLKHDN